MTKRPIFSALVLVSVLIGLTMVGCNKDETTGPGGTASTKLAVVTNLRGYSASISSVGLTWTASTDAANGEALEYQIKTKIDTTTIQSTTASRAATSANITGLIEGTVYTFEVILKATSGAQTYVNSDPITVQWAPARRLTTQGTAPVDVYEIRSSAGGSGIQFFHAATGGPRVLSIASGSGYQGVIDALVDTTTAGVVVLESAHLNPLLVGQARSTKFSTVEGSADSLNIGQSAPPSAGTYTQDRVTVGDQAVAAGKIVYARTSDTNYVRILIKRDGTSGTLLFGASPNRRIRVELSYQGRPGVIYARPGRTTSESIDRRN
jgi:hypothetical protein